MAKKTKVQIDIEVNGKMQKATVAAKDLRKALDGIDKSNKKAAKSAGTLDRNMKGASSASANMTKNFSKMAQGGGGIAAVYAQIAAQVFAVSAAFQFLKSSADVSKLIKGQEALGAVTGVAYKTLTQDLQAATGGQLAYAEAAQAAAIGTAAGLNASQLESLGKAARNASAALGRDLTDSFNRLIRGVTKAEPELLDELGIVLRLKDATEEYALSVGKNVNQLSAFERTQAVANNVLKQSEEKFGKIAKIMDPGAESLNRFLTSFDQLLIQIKTGVIDSLKPVFDFLANNTSALVTAFAALSALIVKSLIPNFGEYAKQASAASFGVKRLLVAQRKEFNALAEAARIAALSVAQRTAEIGANFASAVGVDKGREGGRGALDFLTGASDDGRAAAAANKAIKNQEDQFKDSVEKRTGIFAKFTEDQVKLARASYDERIALLAKEEAANLSTTQKIKGFWDKLWLRLKLGATNFGAWLLKWGARLATGLQLVLIVGAFAGAFLAIASILADLAKAIYRFFFPLSEEAKRAGKEVENLTQKMTSLNEELARMVTVRETVGLTLSESVTQAGQAAASLDIANKATGLQKAAQDLGKGLIDQGQYDALSTQFTEALKSANRLIPGLEGTQEAFLASGKAIDLNIDKLHQFSQAAIQAGQAQTELKRERENFERLQQSFIGSSVDPVVAMVASSARISRGSAQTAVGQINQADLNDQAEQRRRSEISARQNEIRNELGGFSGIALLPAQKQALQDEMQLLRKEAAKIDSGAGAQERAAAVQAALDASSEDALNHQSLLEFQKQYNVRKEQAFDLQKRLATEIVVEKDIHDKINNLTVKRDTLRANEINKANEIALQEKRVNDLKAKGTDEANEQLIVEQDKLDNMNNELDIMKGKNDLTEEQTQLAINIAQIQRDHGIEQIKTKETLLSLEAQALAMLEKESSAQQTINKLEQERIQRNASSAMTEAKLSSALPGFVFDEEGKAEKARIKAEEDINALKLEQIERDKTTAEAKLELEKAQFDIAQQRLAMELAVLNKERGEKNVDSKGLTSEQVRLLGEIETNANSAFTAAGTAIEETYTAAGEAIAASNRELVLAKVRLTNVGQISDTLGQSLEDNLTGAFASLIDGSKNFKDAFADMAKAIIGDIAKIIAKQLALKAISSFGFGFAEGGVAPGGFQAFANGGIAKGGFQKYANGGVVRRPTLGLVGEGKYDEAIVPLPNGNAIPVDMRGGGSQQNNVTVNVAIEGNGRASKDSQSDSKQGAELGSMIATVVQKELQNQKRAGGLLNPMGAS